MAVEFTPFGRLHDGRQVTAAKLKNRTGASLTVLDYGAAVQSLCVPARDGGFVDVVLGYDTAEEYERNGDFFGATIGRVANRIGGAEFELHGKVYRLEKNDGENQLHGGREGFDKKMWRMAAQGDSLLCWRTSPDGEENYPGNLKVQVLFTLTDDNRLCISYDADTDADTPVNLTNHSYFNLNGDPAQLITNHELYVNADAYTPVDSTFMTTGEIAPVEGTPMDFRTAKLVGKDINADYDQLHNGKGYDHNWVLDTGCDDTVLAAELYCPESGIAMKEYTNEPGVQIYAGNFLDGTVTGKKGIVYNFRHAICLETQKYPDTPNKPEWPSALLKPGEKYTSHCVFAFSVR